MATLTKGFVKESEKVHREHYILTEELHAMDLALDHLQPEVEDLSNLMAAKQVQMYVRQLADELPDHFQREEREILSTVADVSPELDFFAREMKRQHVDLKDRLEKLNQAIRELEKAQDLHSAVENVREQGKAFTKQMTQHISAEEQELSGFL